MRLSFNRRIAGMRAPHHLLRDARKSLGVNLRVGYVWPVNSKRVLMHQRAVEREAGANRESG